MGEVALSGLGLFAALLFVALNGLFVSAEFSFVSIRATRVETLVEEGRASARLVREATRKLDAYLAVCQLGITLSSLSLGALGEPAIASLIEPLFEAWGMSQGLIHPIAFAIGFLIITSLHVVLGELVPKSVGIQRPEGTSLFIAPFMRAFYYLFLPLTIVFNGAGNAIVRAFGIRPASEAEETHSENELRTLISQSTRRGALEKRDEDMLEGVFELGETVAREIMVPRPDVAALPTRMPLGELAKVAATGRHTRYPLFEGGEMDRIVGVVHSKDVLQAAEAAGSFKADVVARDLMRELVTVPENRLIESILVEFQRRRIHMAVVIDEWGSFEGIVTIEDILEEIVGEIRDEFDEEEPVIREVGDGSYSIDGRIQIKAVNEVLGSGFESEDFDTTGGLVLGLLGRLPRVGDEASFDGHILRVEGVDGARISQLNVREESSMKPSSGRKNNSRHITLRVGDLSPDGHEAVLRKVENLLMARPGSEIELVVDGAVVDPLHAYRDRATTDRRGLLLALLAESGISVSVRDNTWRVWRPARATRLRKLPASRTEV
ncbi:hemolysin family protein [soil metagenome]